MFILGILGALKQKDKKIKMGMIFTTTLMTVLLSAFSVVVVDKYTKKVKLYRVKNKRLLSIEQIVYTGIVKNVGDHEIGKVTFEVKLVNRGHATGNIKGANFYKSSGFFDFFSGGLDIEHKPQSLTKEFVVATYLKPGEAKAFRVHFRYPPYFSNTSQFTNVWGH
jgi:uncharacterized membrane protein YsdA (DUF1294 family)